MQTDDRERVTDFQYTSQFCAPRPAWQKPAPRRQPAGRRRSLVVAVLRTIFGAKA